MWSDRLVIQQPIVSTNQITTFDDAMSVGDGAQGLYVTDKGTAQML